MYFNLESKYFTGIDTQFIFFSSTHEQLAENAKHQQKITVTQWHSTYPGAARLATV